MLKQPSYLTNKVIQKNIYWLYLKYLDYALLAYLYYLATYVFNGTNTLLTVHII